MEGLGGLLFEKSSRKRVLKTSENFKVESSNTPTNQLKSKFPTPQPPPTNQQDEEEEEKEVTEVRLESSRRRVAVVVVVVVTDT